MSCFFKLGCENWDFDVGKKYDEYILWIRENKILEIIIGWIDLIYVEINSF